MRSDWFDLDATWPNKWHNTHRTDIPLLLLIRQQTIAARVVDFVVGFVAIIVGSIFLVIRIDFALLTLVE